MNNFADSDEIFQTALAEAEEKLTDWIVSGRLKPLENVTTGLENTPAAFIRLMSGKTVGKMVVRLNDRVCTASSRRLERFPEKWTPVFGGKRDKQRNLEHVSDSKWRERALAETTPMSVYLQATIEVRMSCVPRFFEAPYVTGR